MDMSSVLARYLNLTGTTSRGRYLALGVGLFALKFAIDMLIASGFHREWSVRHYLIWPDEETVTVLQLAPANRDFGLVMLGVSLPFVYFGVTQTLRRLRDAGLPLALVVLFFVPLVNLILIALLCVFPPRLRLTPSGEPPVARRARVIHRKVAGESSAGAFAVAVGVSVALTVGIVYLSANLLQSYGFGVFIGAPFVLGWLSVVLFGIPKKRRFGECVLVMTAALVLAGCVLLAVALEGAICILMASPLAFLLGLFGAAVGYVFQSRPWAEDSMPALILTVIVMLPTLTAAESFTPATPDVRAVTTSVIVDAPPEVVWERVVSFPPLDEPTDLLFRSGIAYPRRAEIVGRGPGAVRYCVFSTGPFVEPVEVWDAPNRLAFRVTEQPCPMEELSPFHIHPPHLDNFLVSQRGQFLLDRLPDGRTRLTGTTWYTNRMWPTAYWNVYSDYIIGRIHRRVLDHVRTVAEADVAQKGKP